MRSIEVFTKTYSRDPADVTFCPYRVCPMGAHSDHQYGKITGLAIDKGVMIAYGPKKNGVVEINTQDQILSMEEKPAQPKSHWCCPPFYYYSREDAKLVAAAPMLPAVT